MKSITTTALLIFIIGNIQAVDTVSHRFIDYLRGINRAQAPVIFEDSVVFTVSSQFQRVGISFAHEGYAQVHWFQRFMLPLDYAEIAEAASRDKRNVETLVDSGIMFHIQDLAGAFDAGLSTMDYRLVIDGLWTVDPLNPLTVRGSLGVPESRLVLPPQASRTSAPQAPEGSYRFTYAAAPGETITVAGSFNNWDPFMYHLTEVRDGVYSLTLPLPSGSFQYVFFHRGRQTPDPENPSRLYSREGRITSEGIVR